MASHPLVSVIIPTYNRLPLLREAVASVVAQTFSDWELIVCDDGSSDGTAEYVRSTGDARMQLIEGPHLGFAGSVRNKGIARARGKYIAFLDSDDRWAPNKLQIQLDDLRHKPWAQWSHTYTDWMDDAGRPRAMPRSNAARRPREGWILPHILDRSAWIAMPTVIVERSVMQTLGGFSESVRFCHDFEMWLRLSSAAQAAVVPVPLATIRLHAGSMWSSNVVPALQSFVAIHERFAARNELAAETRSLVLMARSDALTRLAGAQRGEALYAASITSLARALPSGLGRLAWWESLARTLVRPFAFWKRRQKTNQRGTIVAPINSPP